MTFDDLWPPDKRTFAGAEESGVHNMSALIRNNHLKGMGGECFKKIERVFNYGRLTFSTCQSKFDS